MDSLTARLSAIDWNFPRSDTSESIHSIHPYPAKFIREIPRTLIDLVGVPDGTWILDPFCGSGVTLVEAQLKGIPGFGIDLNPIACLICRVKTHPLPDNLANFAIDAIMRARSRFGDVTVPRIPNLDHWFERDVQEAVSALVTAINEVENDHIRDALRLALSSILVRVSNQESDTRYAAIQKDVSADKTFRYFLVSVERIARMTKEHLPKTWEAIVACKDILNTVPSDIERPIGLVITSPPYPNAYEYWLYHKYRMFLLGYDPIQVRQQEIGARAHYFKKSHPTTEDFRRQMQHVFNLIWATLVEGGHACFVIGRSKIHGKFVDNATLLMEIAQEVGFEIIADLQRRIAPSRKAFNLSHAQIQTESVLVFRKPLKNA